MALEDELVNKVCWKIPNALTLVGSRSGDEWNAMTTTWVTQLSMEPVLLGVGVDNSAVTHRLITDGGSFTVNLWPSDDTKVFVKFSKPATHEGDTLNGWSVSTATTGAPVFADALAWMDCEVRQSVDLGTHTLFVGEVVDARINDDERRAANTSDTRMKYGGRQTALGQTTQLHGTIDRCDRAVRSVTLVDGTGGRASCTGTSTTSSSSSPARLCSAWGCWTRTRVCKSAGSG